MLNNLPQYKAQKNSANIKRLILASKYSYSGLKFAWKEGAFRLEVYVLIIVLSIAVFFNFTWWQIIIIAISWLLVMLVEIINSAIEATIDRICSSHHILSKIAKDLGSAAVFLSAIIAILVTSSIFYVHFFYKI